MFDLLYERSTFAKLDKQRVGESCKEQAVSTMNKHDKRISPAYPVSLVTRKSIFTGVIHLHN